VTPRSALALALSLLVAPAAHGAALAPSVPILAPGNVPIGAHAEVRTVFQGTRIESFDAEILGLLRGGRAEGDMILARATSERVIRTGIAQGMSGSPVYVDGKLIGALSSGWQFSKEPIFGITPITEMLPILELPASRVDDGTAGPSGVDSPGYAVGARFGAFSWPGDDTDAVDLVSSVGPTGAARRFAEASGLKALALPLSCAGLNAAALDPVRRALEPLGLAVVPGGRAQDGGPPADALAPGAAVAVDVMRGDLQMSAIGTVTYRDGNRILIFGHPLFQSGEVRMPLSTAEITTIIPSDVSSFKLGVTGREAGTATEDRRTAVGGLLGAAPRMLPLGIDVSAAGARPQRFRFDMLEDRALAPSLVPVAALNALLESGGTGASQTLRWKLTLHRHGAGPLVLADVATGENASSELLSGIGAPLRFLFNNPFERLMLDSLALDLGSTPRREQWSLRGARLAVGPAVRPGGRVTVHCDLEPWRGGRDTRDVTLRIPEELPAGRYVVWVGGGAEWMRFEAQRVPGRYRPTSLDDAWRRLAALRSSDALYAFLIARAPEVTSEGRDYPELPLSALLVLASGASAGERGRPGDTAFLDEARVPVEGVLRGEQVLEINVDPKAP
jgi:hypothetical protein